MLGIAISAFFAIAFFGAVTVIATMFFQYRNRIAQVIQHELNTARAQRCSGPAHYSYRTVRPRQPMSQHRSPQPVQLRAAA